LERFVLNAAAEGIMDVRELMTSPVRTVGTDDTLNNAAKLMRDHALGCLPVVDAVGKLAGMLTDRDIALSAYETGEALWRLRVDESMKTPVYTVRPGDDISVAARVMRDHRVRRLPVIDESGSPVGMISLDDLSHASRQPVLEPTPGLTTDEIGDVYDATSGRSKHARGGRR
jgi:CBS domain-containing protein